MKRKEHAALKAHMKLIYFLDMVTVQYMSLAANGLVQGTGQVERIVLAARIELAVHTGLAASRISTLAAAAVATAVSVNTAHDEHMNRVRAQ